MIDGTSLRLCTAMSIAPRSSASSSSLMKSPLPPIVASETSWRLSPVVFITTSSGS
jgi:hypothetical protein